MSQKHYLKWFFNFLVLLLYQFVFPGILVQKFKNSNTGYLHTTCMLRDRTLPG